jgi:hypothetical protein
MITITRNLARHLRSVIRRALHVTPSCQPAIHFLAGSDGLRVQARNREAAIQYHQAGEFPAERFLVPYELLADCEARKEEPIELTAEGNRVLASWRDGAVQQVVRYAVPRVKEEPFPAEPDNFVANEPDLWHALRDAGQVTDEDSPRYALACLQLRGSGQIAATDGHQALLQAGFHFPWQGELLVRANRLLGSQELRPEETLLVGGGKDWVTLRLGAWTLHLAIEKMGKFPRIDEVLRSPDDATTRWALSEPDAQFVLENLPKLPAHENDEQQSVTLDLSDRAVIRSRATEERPPSELILTGSPTSGSALRISIGRHYLLHALRLGLREVFAYGPEAVLFSRDERRTYCWMPISADSVVGPSSDTIRIESPAAGSVPVAATSTKRTTMPKSKTKNDLAGQEISNGHASQDVSGNGHGEPQSPETSGTADVLAEALALKQALQEALAKTNSLIAALRRQSRQSRLLRSTLESLRELQTVAG